MPCSEEGRHVRWAQTACELRTLGRSSLMALRSTLLDIEGDTSASAILAVDGLLGVPERHECSEADLLLDVLEDRVKILTACTLPVIMAQHREAATMMQGTHAPPWEAIRPPEDKTWGQLYFCNIRSKVTKVTVARGVPTDVAQLLVTLVNNLPRS